MANLTGITPQTLVFIIHSRRIIFIRVTVRQITIIDSKKSANRLWLSYAPFFVRGRRPVDYRGVIYNPPNRHLLARNQYGYSKL